MLPKRLNDGSTGGSNKITLFIKSFVKFSNTWAGIEPKSGPWVDWATMTNDNYVLQVDIPCRYYRSVGFTNQALVLFLFWIIFCSILCRIHNYIVTYLKLLKRNSIQLHFKKQNWNCFKLHSIFGSSLAQWYLHHYTPPRVLIQRVRCTELLPDVNRFRRLSQTQTSNLNI